MFRGGGSPRLTARDGRAKVPGSNISGADDRAWPGDPMMIPVARVTGVANLTRREPRFPASQAGRAPGSGSAAGPAGRAGGVTEAILAGGHAGPLLEEGAQVADVAEARPPGDGLELQ